MSKFFGITTSNLCTILVLFLVQYDYVYRTCTYSIIHMYKSTFICDLQTQI